MINKQPLVARKTGYKSIFKPCARLSGDENFSSFKAMFASDVVLFRFSVFADFLYKQVEISIKRIIIEQKSIHEQDPLINCSI